MKRLYLNRFITKIDAEKFRRFMDQKEQRIFVLVREKDLEELKMETSGIPFVYNNRCLLGEKFILYPIDHPEHYYVNGKRLRFWKAMC